MLSQLICLLYISGERLSVDDLPEVIKRNHQIPSHNNSDVNDMDVMETNDENLIPVENTVNESNNLSEFFSYENKDENMITIGGDSPAQRAEPSDELLQRKKKRVTPTLVLHPPSDGLASSPGSLVQTAPTVIDLTVLPLVSSVPVRDDKKNKKRITPTLLPSVNVHPVLANSPPFA